MSLANFLSSALTVGTQAAGAREAGLAQRGQRETQDLLQKIQLARQANQDAMAKQLHQAQIDNYQSLAADRLRPSEETFGDLETVNLHGTPAVVQRGSRGTVRPVEGATPYVAPKDNSTLSETVRHNKAMEALAGQRAGGVGGAGKPPTSAELKTGALLMVAEQANALLRNMGSKQAPSWLDQQRSKVGMGLGNVMTPDEYQRLRQASHQLSDAWLRYTSGAAVPETEVMRFAETFTPLAGDSPALLAQKAKARETMIRAMRKGAGRASPDVLNDYELPNPRED